MEQIKNMNEGMLQTPMGVNMQPAPQAPIEPMPEPMEAMPYQAVYPEIYYKLQPFVLMVVDQMDTYGSGMPTQDMVEQLCDGIYEDACRLYPDMEEYSCDRDREAVPTFNGFTPDSFGRSPGMFRRRRQRRAPIRNLIEILLLSELFRRRRRPFYW